MTSWIKFVHERIEELEFERKMALKRYSEGSTFIQYIDSLLNMYHYYLKQED